MEALNPLTSPVIQVGALGLCALMLFIFVAVIRILVASYNKHMDADRTERMTSCAKHVETLQKQTDVLKEIHIWMKRKNGGG